MSEWIRCKESHPVRHRLVLATDRTDVYFAIWNGDFWFHDGCAVYVTDWMEIPELPQ